jgi:hypothetical protein
MPSITVRSLFFLFILSLASSLYAQTNRCAPILNPPVVIEKAGVYCLIVNVNYKQSNGAAISVLVNDVTIDLNGFTLSGAAGGANTFANGISALNRQNITIKNGTIRGFFHGIRLRDNSPFNTVSQRHLIEDVVISRSKFQGIHAEGSDITVRRNRIVDTIGSDLGTYGLYIEGRGARVFDNDIVRTKSTGEHTIHGVFLLNAPGAVVENNRIDTVTSAGGNHYALRFSASNDALAVGNRITNAEVGIFFAGSNGKYRDNLTVNVEKPYIGDGTDAGNNN